MTQITIPISYYKLPVSFGSGFVTHDGSAEPSTWFDSLFWWNRKQQERWVKSKDLGVGAFGHVWLESCSSSDSEPPKLRAVKRVQKVIMFHHNMDYTREIQAMVRFSQPKYASFFVKSLGWFEDPDSVYITMEYFELGDLSKYLSSQPLQEAEAREIIFQLLSGLELLHDNGFVHRDLKPANIFVVQGAPNWHVKIGDFGISKRVKDGTRLRTVIGTPQYLAPEVRDGIYGVMEDEDGDLAYTNSVDMWSVGVISFYILTGSLPFKNSSHVRAFVRGGPFPCSKLRLVESSLTSQKFIEALIVVEPARRLSAARALQHAWFETLKQVKSASTDGDESDILPETANAPEPNPGPKPALFATGTPTRNAQDQLDLRHLPQSRLSELFLKHQDLDTLCGGLPEAPFQMGAGVDSRLECGCTLLHLVAQYNHMDLVELLLQHGASVTIQNDHGWTPLHAAANAGRTEAVTVLLEHGAVEVVNLGNKDGWTPLHEAAFAGHRKACQLLLQHGAKIDMADRMDRTALFVAARKGHVSVMKLLLQFQANIDAVGERGRSILQEAAKQRHVEVVRLLLQHGANVEIKNVDGWTPLHETAFVGSMVICELLVGAGARTLTTDLANRTPLDIANARSHLEISEYLADHQEREGAEQTSDHQSNRHESNEGPLPV